jgi:hypothetical protein
VGASVKATSVDASEVPCCADSSILLKKSIVITAKTSRHFMGFFVTSISVFDEPLLGQRFARVFLAPKSGASQVGHLAKA